MKITPKEGKKKATISIIAKENIQYSINDCATWKLLAKSESKTIKENMLKNKVIYIRYPGNTEKLILPSLVTKYNINNSVITEISFGYDEDNKVICFNRTIK
jgi:hypothetical protein